MSSKETKVYGYRWVILIVFALIQAGIQVLWASFLPITGDAARFYEVTPLAIGFLSMLFMIVYVVISLPSSAAISTFGVRRGVGFGVVLMGVFGLVRGIWGENYLVVMISTIFLSVAQPFIINSITTMTARWFPVDERATATGLAILAQLLGILGGMAITPVLAVAVGIKSTLMIYGVFAAAVALVFMLFYREHPPAPPGLQTPTEEIPRLLEGLKHFFKSRDAILI